MMLIKILVVDDSASDRLIIKNMLSEYNILTACDGIEAMELLHEYDDINLLILDINMPNMNGFQVLEEIKSKERFRKLRTIILTNYDELDNEIKGLRMGAVDYIRKPIHMDSLKARIDVHVELLYIQLIFEQKLYEQGITFDAVFYQAPVGIAISHSVGPYNINSSFITSINPMFEKITGRTQEELIGLGWASITHPDDLEEDMKCFNRLQSGEINSYSMEKRYVKPDGTIVWVDMTVALLTLSNDQVYNHICLIQDITKRKIAEKALEESERSKSVLLSHLPGLAYRCNYDREWTMIFVSDGCYELTGYSSQSLVNNNEISFRDLITPEYREPLWNEWRDVLEKQAYFKYEYEIITAKGEQKWVLEMGQGIYNKKGEVEALEGIILDITERKKMENNLRYKNEHDSNTGLYNRNYLESLLVKDAIINEVEKRAVIGINLSAVQSLTTIYGFHYTQELIKNTSNILRQHCTDNKLLFNTYENQFVYYLKNYKDKNELLKFCEIVANTLEFLLMSERIGGGIGVVEIDKYNESDADQLLKKLLITSERAIESFDGDFGVCFYDEEMEAQIIREEDIKVELARIATDEGHGGLFLQYQPILDLKLNKILEFEALARLNSDKLGLVMPKEFISIAEKTKLITNIGQKIIIQAFSFLNKLRDSGYDTVSVSINVSVIQLLKNDFCKTIFELIEKMQVNPENICFELTESVFSTNYEEINYVIGNLKEFGIRIAIDDFGTGYSSLAREQELNVNCIKIDKYFIDNLLSDNPEKFITSDIISMAHKFDHCVIAEGVEYEKQKEYLEKFGCDKIQGYLIAKPLDESNAIKFLNYSTE